MKLALVHDPVRGPMVVDEITEEMVHGVRAVQLTYDAAKPMGGRAQMVITLLNSQVLRKVTATGDEIAIRMVDPRNGQMRQVKAITWDNGETWSPAQ